MTTEKRVKSVFCPRSQEPGAHGVYYGGHSKRNARGREVRAYRCDCGHTWARLAVPPPADLLVFAEEVCKEYREKGYAMTLRQLYYQGVSRAFLPSGQDAYDALKEALAKARLAGKFPLWAIVDRTRHVLPGLYTRCDDNVETALRRSAAWAAQFPEQFIHRDRWFNQPNHVSVWFEKEALAGIFEDTCDRLGVGWFSTHGDPSHPALYQWLRRAAEAHGVDNPKGWRDPETECASCQGKRGGDNRRGMAQRSVVLYFGDHDPTGMRIPETAEETLRTFMRIAGLDFPLEFRRIGVTMEMARRMDLPPFPAKQTAGADYDRYVERYRTRDAWELDALPPEVLEAEVERAVSPLFDAALYDRLQTGVRQRRAQMRVGMRGSSWHLSATAFPED